MDDDLTNELGPSAVHGFCQLSDKSRMSNASIDVTGSRNRLTTHSDTLNQMAAHREKQAPVREWDPNEKSSQTKAAPRRAKR